jgi:hypothetical protein
MRKHFALKADAPVGIVSSFGTEQSVNTNSRSLWVTATTSDIDLDKEVVVPVGADTSYFFRVGSCYIDHQYDFGSCVGKLRSAQPIVSNGEQTGWKCHIGILPLTKSPYADDVLVMAQNGGVGVSIGFNATDVGKPSVDEMKRYKQGALVPRSIVRSWNWMETSITMMPCNMQALQLGYGQGMEKAAKELDTLIRKRLDSVDNLLTSGRISAQTAEAFGFQRSDRRKETQIRRILFIDN